MESSYKYHERVLAGRFELERRIGVGGFGVVYLAHDRQRDAKVALKVLSKVEPDNLLRFKKEFRTLTDVVHPNLVTLYELGNSEDVWFFSMEYVDGEDLVDELTGGFVSPSARTGSPQLLDAATMLDVTAELDVEATLVNESATHLPTAPDSTSGPLRAEIARARVEPGEMFPPVDAEHTRHVLRQLTEGLLALHGHGKLHRDIKPSNVMVTEEGRVVILDFGMVWDLLTPEAHGDGEERIFAGTPRYASPEQAAGLPITDASDWYAVGAVLYRAITGFAPIDADSSAEILRRKQFLDPIDIAELRDDVPEDLCRLTMDLLSRDPLRRPDGREILERIGAATPRPHALRDREPAEPTFVGRRAELQRFREAFARAEADDKPQMVRVVGRSGMGKSALARRFIEQMRDERDGLVVLSGRCYENESVPYKALDELIDALSTRIDERRDDRELWYAGVSALARLFPVFGRLEEKVDAADTLPLVAPDEASLRQKAIAFLRSELRLLADDAPVILYIDDVQWADRDSADLLADVLTTPAPPIFLVMTCRPEALEGSPFVDTLHERLSQAQAAVPVEEITLRGFSQDEAGELVREVLGEHGAHLDVAQLTSDAQGNPFFIDELARHLMRRETGARLDLQNLDDLIATRVAKMSDSARLLLEIVAVASRPIRRSVAARVANLGDEEPQAIAGLRAERLIRLVSAGDAELCETYHDRVRETVVAGLADAQRREHHRRMAEVLEDVGADAIQLAQHLFESGQTERASSYVLQAAHEAERSFAYDRAAELLATAQTFGDEMRSDRERYDLLMRRADLLAKLARNEEAAGVYKEASALADGLERLETKRLVAEETMRAGHVEPALDELHEILESFDVRLPDPQSPLLLLKLGWRQLRLMTRTLHPGDNLGGELDKRDEVLLESLAVAGGLLATIDLKTSGYCQMLYLETALELGDPTHSALAMSMHALLDGSAASNRQKGFELLDRAEGMADQSDRPGWVRVVAGLVRGVLLYSSGLWRESDRSFRESIASYDPRQTEAEWEYQTLRFYSLMPLFWLGEFERYTDLIAEIREEAERQNNLLLRVAVGSWSYLANLAADRSQEAIAGLKAAAQDWESPGYHMPHFWYLLGMGETLIYEGRGADAMALVEENWWPIHKSLLMRVEIIAVLIHHLRGRAALCALRNEPSRMRQWQLKSRARRSARALEKFGRPHSDGIASMLRAELAAHDGRQDEAVELYERAEQLLDETHTGFYAHAARRRRGILLGGEEGDRLIDEARAWLVERGVESPDAMASMATPSSIPLNALPR